MKNVLVWIALLCGLLAVSACKKEKPAPMTACLEAKFEAFKQSPWATKIVKINRPDGAFYWLVQGGVADEGEEVLNDQCEVACTADCYCTGSGLCEGGFLNFPQEVIWER